jgi:RNA polymerase sigma-70 factor (ECF subfamily)
MTMIKAETRPETSASRLVDADVRRLQDSLARYCLVLTGTKWDAEDLAQDAWVRAISSLRSAGHPNAEAYMLRIAKNAWIDRSRRKDPLPRLLTAASVKADDSAEHGLVTEHAFAAVVQHLSPQQCAVFLLRDLLDYSGTETAELLGTTEGAVKAALRRARQALSRIRSDWDNETIPEPEDEAAKTLIRSLAEAYRRGDAARIAQLAAGLEVLPPVTAVGVAQVRAIRRRPDQASRPVNPSACMAA